MFELIIIILVIITTLVASVLALVQTDLLKVAILTGVSGVGIAFLYQILLAPDVALTQAIVGGAIIPVFLALAVKKTKRVDDE
ncbi:MULTISPECIES: DUF4040 domain-containing protein [Methanobrevibacter]|jgi:energy-converting hydrogenase B subunit D|uniref:DUF4040 domain-containing protein n=1 Tax=Methanobrevibacter TaxID=2172 RepID=UPI00033485E7|nr:MULTISPECIES: DUF4040 domain-containing protein [Methanobrevibacter]AGN17456.1 energy-converting hydrogenase B subunit D EhbD [Methanobrevibacter sp. AbM4]MCI6775499.1 DUF4040 domain-containing protein [Methanobrevibacter boviskoreani]MCI6930424.1 DUF4040 domain-containing protein [Methanobrevibacter boviskoreani]MDD6256850.1 DUF4040 domain-containing protein [Methanobrevibacter boviskoreani]MDY5614922.1 DUF4040 domain-containing protein [Methanobrevibacter boviskoreani]